MTNLSLFRHGDGADSAMEKAFSSWVWGLGVLGEAKRRKSHGGYGMAKSNKIDSKVDEMALMQGLTSVRSLIAGSRITLLLTLLSHRWWERRQ